MFKRTRSKVNQPVQVGQVETKNDLLIDGLLVWFKDLVVLHRRFTLAMMGCVIIVSCILAFTVIRFSGENKLPAAPAIFSGSQLVIASGLMIYRDLERLDFLQAELDAIARKKVLVPADSVLAAGIFQEMDSIMKRHQVKLKK